MYAIRSYYDPLSHEISHIVVSMNGNGERQVDMGYVQSVMEGAVELRSASSDIVALPPFRREDYVTTHEVEIAHLEEKVHVTPGEVLVPFPELEKSVKRRTFFMNFTHAIGFLIGLPIAFPILRYLMKPMYAPLDNGWLKIVITSYSIHYTKLYEGAGRAETLSLCLHQRDPVGTETERVQTFQVPDLQRAYGWTEEGTRNNFV